MPSSRRLILVLQPKIIGNFARVATNIGCKSGFFGHFFVRDHVSDNFESF